MNAKISMRILKEGKWLGYTVGASFSWAVWGILTKFMSSNLSPYSYQILFTLGMLLSLVFIFKKCKLSSVKVKGVVFGIAGSLLALTGNIFVYKSFISGGQASVVLPITNLYPLVTTFLAVLFFKEKIHYINGLGMLIVIPAILMLSGQSDLFYNPLGFYTKLDMKIWLLFAFVAMILFGIFSASQKITTLYLPAELSYIIFIAASVLISFFFMVFKLVDFNFSRDTFLIGTGAGFFDGLGVLLIYSAYRSKGKAVQVSSTVTVIQQVFTILLAVVILREKLTVAELAGLVMAVAGSWLILLERNMPSVDQKDKVL